MKRLLTILLGYAVSAAFASIVLLSLGWGKPNSLPIFFITLAAAWLVSPVATRVIDRLRFKLWRRRGWTEFWVRSPEPVPGGLANGWVRDLLSVRAPLVDFVTNESRDGSWVNPATFLVNGRIPPDRRHLELSEFAEVNFGPGFRVVSFQTTRGPIDVAGYPEAIDQLDAELFGQSEVANQ
ncbi:hypothetical protein [Arthrobacter sp. efr-133-R2A-120]|uniref:hypothetical protein n=1 Tax=Arthrobacter sp. efr-133-R2A-120 TaxID=3040277 RepID=UPI0025506241|nr:hypothetical protein [Arthrobacter sp. efr-133-R2A-120]